MNNHPEYTVEARNERGILIRDLAEHFQCRSITNGPEEVVKELYDRGLLGNRRLFYIDTMGFTDELTHDEGKFMSYVHGNEDVIKSIFGFSPSSTPEGG